MHLLIFVAVLLALYIYFGLWASYAHKINESVAEGCLMGIFALLVVGIVGGAFFGLGWCLWSIA